MANVPQQADKAPDFQAFFSNPMVFTFLTELIKSALGIFKKDISDGAEAQLKEQVGNTLQNLAQITDPAFMKTLAQEIVQGMTKSIASETAKVIQTIQESAAKPEELSELVEKSVARGVSNGMPLAIQEVLSRVKAKSTTELTVEENGL